MVADVKTAELADLFPWELLFRLAEYRLPRPITEYRLNRSFHGDQAFYYCPRCDITLDREFQACCDRCGQHGNIHGSSYGSNDRGFHSSCIGSHHRGDDGDRGERSQQPVRSRHSIHR